MTDIAVEVSGEMDTAPPMPQKTFNYFQLPTQIPDPKTWILQQRQNVRPWTQFVQSSNFKAPPSVTRLSRRIMRNIEYFQSNYLFVFLGLVAYCLITSPLLLIAIGGSFYAGYKLSKRHQQKKVEIFGKELTLAQQYGLVAVCSMPIYYMLGAHGIIFWVLGATCFIIILHASFYNIEALMQQDDSFTTLLQEWRSKSRRGTLRTQQGCK